MTTGYPSYFATARGVLVLWTGVLAGPLLWITNQQINYLLVGWACASGRVYVLHLVSLACLLPTLAAARLAGRVRRQLQNSPPVSEPVVHGRSLFLATLGLMTSVLFALVIIAQDIPNFVVDPCQR